MALKVITHNARGLNSPRKCRQAFQWYERLHPGVICIQETHFTKTLHPQFLHRQYSRHFLSSAPQKKHRGVAILIHNNLPLIITETELDKEGQYISIMGTLYERTIRITATYAPNDKPKAFFNRLARKLTQTPVNIDIWCGDFNFPFNPVMDKSNSTHSTKDNKAARATQDILNTTHFVDTWRELHPKTREYTYYSAPHKQYSRIDTILLNTLATPNLKESCIKPCPWSDHDLVATLLVVLDTPIKHTRWRLNESLLSDPQLVIDSKTTLTNYFKENNTPEVTPDIIWAAHKATIRGYFIQQAAIKQKKERETNNKLEKSLQILEKQNQTKYSHQITKQIKAIKQELNTLQKHKVDKAIRWTDFKYYKYCNKPDRFLAKLLKDKTQINQIPRIKTPQGDITSNPEKIRDTFLEYYRKLYAQPHKPNRNATHRFLAQHPTPTLTIAEVERLNESITLEDIGDAIKNLKLGKAPGPDGLSAGYYKKFSEILIPQLKTLYDYIAQGKKIAPELLAAHITLIPKPNKDPLHPKHYRPISLLNLDLKILTSILSKRLAAQLPKLIHKDQVGFIPFRQAGDNIRKILNIIHQTKKAGTQMGILTLDIEKAFDSLDWDYLETVLQSIGIKGSFINILQTYYSTPTATLKLPASIQNKT
uniref:Reverse transcriptase domain-containing protein n=1 Tax=Xenopus tropicalis TaxID=8364 RepID=A0A803JCB5_XENTR